MTMTTTTTTNRCGQRYKQNKHGLYSCTCRLGCTDPSQVQGQALTLSPQYCIPAVRLSRLLLLPIGLQEAK